jgi:hypothetical protein
MSPFFCVILLTLNDENGTRRHPPDLAQPFSDSRSVASLPRQNRTLNPANAVLSTPEI